VLLHSRSSLVPVLLSSRFSPWSSVEIIQHPDCQPADIRQRLLPANQFFGTFLYHFSIAFSFSCPF
jgi:hypothetical protein